MSTKCLAKGFGLLILMVIVVEARLFRFVHLPEVIQDCKFIVILEISIAYVYIYAHQNVNVDIFMQLITLMCT